VVYFDTSYLVRLYLQDQGAEAVRTLAAKSDIACCLHGRIECIAAFHRACRERGLAHSDYLTLLDQFDDDDNAGGFSWLPFELALTARAEKVYRAASSRLFLRAADALHLACAIENGFREIYSHDRRMLSAAPYFGLKGKNIIN
jgi:predicted nucleic acid-binding protein